MEKSLPVEILDKYINGDCNNEEIAIVREWYASFEHDKDYTAGLDLATEKRVKRPYIPAHHHQHQYFG